MSKSKDTAAPGAVLTYLNKQNRPYSAIDIFNNLHKEYGKTAVVKALESLAEQGKIREKTYGKQKVYVADQAQFAVVDEAELKRMEQEIGQISGQLKLVNGQCKQLDAELGSLNSAMSTEEAQQQLVHCKQEISRCEEKLRVLQSNKNAVSPVEREKIMKSREKYVKAWKKRKRIAKDILDAILENYPKSKQDLFEEIGVETDEEFKVKPPDV